KRELAETSARQDAAKMAADLQRQKDEEERRAQLDSKKMHLTQQQLEAERQARLEAEEQTRQHAEVAELERLQRQELERIQAELEQLLLDERQAKRDEETVRALQA
ncbi:PREDICTED: switch-associated protein 70-like, partial [Priapulus caudatus]|uniref:Switch-associated protein 70-like n=1 Tax=Priapulus caudatus TaxID=37621 RepID=A0ABM1F7R1_PRICU